MKRFNLYVAILLMCLLGTCSMVKAETIKVTQAPMSAGVAARGVAVS